LSADERGYRGAMDAQRARSRAAAGFAHAAGAGLVASVDDAPPTVFLGYASTIAPARVLALRDAQGGPRTELRAGDEGTVVLDETPFYAEGGGQVGDQGVLQGDDGVFKVATTRSDGAGHHLHIGRVAAGEMRAGATVEARVDPELRA